MDKESRISWIKQSWNLLQGNLSKLPEELKQMMKVANEFNIRIQARKCNMEIKEKKVIWHYGMKPKDNYKWNKKVSICLRLNHGVVTMKVLRI